MDICTYRIIDISIPMKDNMFTFPGGPAFEKFGPYNVLPGNNPEYFYYLMLCTQTGTHIQGAHHFMKNGRRIHQYPLTAFEGEAVVVDIPNGEIDRDYLAARLEGEKLENRIVILRSGHMDDVIARYHRLQKTQPVTEAALTAVIGERPGLSPAAAEFLVDKHVKMVCIDSLGVESRFSPNYEVNAFLCQNDVLILEQVINLYAIKKPRVFLQAFPLPIEGVEGTPCRAIVKEEV